MEFEGWTSDGYRRLMETLVVYSSLGYGVWLSNQHPGKNVHSGRPARLLKNTICTLHINPEVYVLLVPIPDEESL